MSSAMLAALVVGTVPLFVYPQDHLGDVRWPSHAVVTVPQGFVKDSDHLLLTEDDRPALAQIETVARWPDGSPKWIHVYTSLRYQGGKASRYVLVRQATAPELPASPLKVIDQPAGIQVDTGAMKFTVARPFAGITLIEQGGQTLVRGEGGPSLVDDRGITWHAMHDAESEVVVEQQGPAQVTIRATGWYQTAERRVPAFCRFTTRIVAFANSPLIKIDHATTFAGDMRRHALSELSFKFAVPDVTGYATSASRPTPRSGAPPPAAAGGLRGKIGATCAAAWLAQLGPDELLALTQVPPDNPAAVTTAGNHGRSAGWFAADTAQRRVALLTKDFWQKYPKEVKIGRDELTYYAWPRHGELGQSDQHATRPEGVYKFQCFLTGRLLDPRLPSEYFSALELQKDTTECKAQYARAANLEGVSVHNEFALLCLPAAADAAASDDQVARWQRLFADNPIARVSPTAIASSGVLGPVAPSTNTFPEVERTVRDAMLGYARSIERYGDYGWSIYGNTHHEEWMNPAAAGTPLGRPSLHRVWNNNHYQHVSTSWRLFALHGDNRLLQWARTCTDNYASIGQVRYDGLRGRVDGNGQQHPGPSVKYHNPGAFWHCKAFVPWGGRDYGMDSNDNDSGLFGHWPDPSSLLFAWLFDANRWAKDGYELWLERVQFPRSGARREINTTLVHAITAYEYRPNEATLAAIKGMAQGLSSMPIMSQRPGPIWEPTWLSRYHELVPDDQAFNQFIVKSADEVGLIGENIWSLALSATAYRITKDDKYLRRHAGTLARLPRQLFQDAAADKRWEHYGLAPGPARDRQFMLQWHRFSAALRDANITSLPAPDEPGQYFCGVTRWDNKDDIAARGTKIVFWKDEPASLLTVQASTLAGGSIGATSLSVSSPSHKSVLDIKRLAISSDGPSERVVRPSSWEASQERHPLPAGEPGLYTSRFGSFQLGIFQPLTPGRECQLLQNSKLRNWGEPCTFVVKLTRGYLAPLVSGRIQLTFTAMGERDGSYVSVRGAKQEAIAERYLRAGESITVTLNERGVPAGPWLLDAFSDFSGFLRLSITANGDEPLLYGRRLEDVQFIRGKLPQPSNTRQR